MRILIFILVSLMLGGLYFALGRLITNGLKTGKISATNGKTLCDKTKNPAAFRFSILLIAVIMLFCLVAWLKALIGIFLG